MPEYNPKFAGATVKTLIHTSGTVSVGSPHFKANVQAVLDGNSTYHVAVMPVESAAATCSKANCAAVLSNLGVYEFWPSSNQKYIAWRVYNGSSAITGTATDKLIVEKLD